jgi:hypothetical protein
MTIVSFEKPRKDEKGELQFDVIGTGFLSQHKEMMCLVTAKHVVVDDSGGLSKNTFVSVNLTGGGIGRILLDDFEKIHPDWKWRFHSNVELDLAILPFPKALQWAVLSLGPDLYEKFENIVEGDDIFFLGFPLGIASEKKVSPLVRGGMISLKREDRTFLIDATVFPGNSGSPVFLKPSVVDFSKRQIGVETPAKFLGIISGYLPYVDAAISPQTGRTRISFEENSGLAVVHSADLVTEILESPDFQKTYASLKEGLKTETIKFRQLVKKPE